MEKEKVEVLEEKKEDNLFFKIIKNKWFKSGIIFILVFAVTFFGFNATIDSTFVEGNSMYPTLENGDYAITYKLGFKIGSIKRFDIITFAHNDDIYVKRVIGLPGETLVYDNGVLYIDGEVVEETFISNSYKIETAKKKKDGKFTVNIPEGEYFVMGDNRKVSCGADQNSYCSYDSRSFGTILYEDIKSRGITIIGKCDSVENGKCEGRSFSWPKKVK